MAATAQSAVASAAPPTHLPGGYRPHLDGLRGIAVLAVLLYHYHVPGFGGGFVGVDIFFVISGYLISRILVAEIEAGRFSIASFYERRFRRLFPALFLMLVVVTAIGWFVILPRAYDDYGQSLAAVLLGLSNFHFWSESAAYFQPVTETLPLLHSWSLAVEEQFYLAFPLLLAALLRRGRMAAMAVIAIVLLASLLLATWMGRTAPTAAFYFPLTRGWELLIGAALALHLEAPQRKANLSNRVSSALGLAGLGLMAFSIAAFAETTAMPGLAALVPCLGAALLIWSGADGKNPATRLLAIRPLVWVGLVSYGLYLWHWPIHVLLRHHILAAPLGPGWTATAAAAAFGAAALSFHAVEMPVRRRIFLERRRRLFTVAAAGAALLLASGLWIARTGGFPGRMPEFAAYAQPPWHGEGADLLCSARELALKPACLSAAAPPDQRRVLLWGDSFAGHYEGAFARLKDRLPFAIAIEADAGCPPMFGLGLRFNPGCRRAIEGIPALIDRAGVDIVILSARWEAQRGGLRTDLVEATVRRLRARGVTVILFGQSPVFPFNHPDEYHFREVRRGASPDSGRADNVAPEQLNHLLRDLARSTGAYFFDPAPALCRERSCLYRQEGDYLFREASHLTDRGALKVLGLFLSSPDFGAEGRLWRATPGPALPSDLSPGSNGPGSNVDAPGRDSG